MTRRRPLYTPEEARAEAEREGERDDRNYELAKEGGGCCLLGAVSSLGALALPIAGLLVLLTR